MNDTRFFIKDWLVHSLAEGRSKKVGYEIWDTQSPEAADGKKLVYQSKTDRTYVAMIISFKDKEPTSRPFLCYRFGRKELIGKGESKHAFNPTPSSGRSDYTYYLAYSIEER